jgi:hypothetical protein
VPQQVVAAGKRGWRGDHRNVTGRKRAPRIPLVA